MMPKTFFFSPIQYWLEHGLVGPWITDGPTNTLIINNLMMGLLMDYILLNVNHK